jgi:2-polyprenyl-3-methyl-5-hydroxy-6-metoxy-1,4-benzoquinol methylase
MKCIVCQSDNIEDIYQKIKLNLVKCNNCGSVFKKIMPTHQELVQIYNNFYKIQDDNVVSTQMETNNKVLKSYANNILHNETKIKTLIDIGCGTGIFLQELKYLNTNTYLEGLEFDTNARNIASQDFNVYQELYDIKKDFDVVTMIEVIEHLTDPLSFMKNVSKLLNKDGTLYLTTPNINSLRSKLDKENYSEINKPFHLIIFSQKSLEILLKKAGFTNIRFIRYTPFPANNLIDLAKIKLLQSLNLYGGLFVIAKK